MAQRDSDLRAVGIDDLEVLKMPGGSNPSWITAEQLDRIDALLGEWPGLPELTEEITVSLVMFLDVVLSRCARDARFSACWCV